MSKRKASASTSRNGAVLVKSEAVDDEFILIENEEDELRNATDGDGDGIELETYRPLKMPFKQANKHQRHSKRCDQSQVYVNPFDSFLTQMDESIDTIVNCLSNINAKAQKVICGVAYELPRLPKVELKVRGLGQNEK